MLVKIEITNHFGIFTGEELSLTQEQYDKYLEITKTILQPDNNEVYEGFLDDGRYIIIPKEIMQKSIITYLIR